MSDTSWPRPANPAWPRGCLIENAAIHPYEPWLAVACTNSEAETGAILVFDAQTGSLRSSTTLDGYVGWSDAGLLRWHGDGVRLATNVGTNGIALLDRAELVGMAFPNDTRDGGVTYVWIGDELFTDTGALFRIEPGDERFDFDELDIPDFQAIAWHEQARVVVGRVGRGLAAYDPIAARLVYHAKLDAYGEFNHLSPSPDGRWCVARRFAVPPASDELLFVEGASGRVHGIRTPSLPRIDQLAWSSGGALALSCYVHHLGGARGPRHVDIFREGERRLTIDLGAHAITASHAIPDASGIAWSPAGDGLALLLDRQRVQVFDAQTAKLLTSFDAPAPAIPAGLPDYYMQSKRHELGCPGDLMWLHRQYLVRIAPHFVSIWSLEGTEIARFVVPT